MKLDPVIRRMKTIHARLDQEIRRELKTRWPDRHRVARLKKLRLAIKDRIYGTAPRALSAG